MRIQKQARQPIPAIADGLPIDFEDVPELDGHVSRNLDEEQIGFQLAVRQAGR